MLLLEVASSAREMLHICASRSSLLDGMLRKLLPLTLLALVFTVLVPSASYAAEDSGTTVGGTISSRASNADGVKQPHEGVSIVVTDASGTEIGSAISGPDGAWSIAVPDAGSVVVTLDESTLPEGVSIREGTESARELTLKPERKNTVLFPLGEIIASEGGSIKFVQLGVDGIKLGLIIGMTAIGLSLIFGTTGLVNFAHGEMVTIGAMIAYLLNVTGVFGFKLTLILAGILAVLLSGLAGGLFNEFVWRRLRDRGSSLISMLVVSIGFSILLRYSLLYLFGGRGKSYSDYHIQRAIDFGPFGMAPKDIVIVILSIVVLVSVGTLLRLTRMGKAMRAVADNRDLAESSGIDVESVIRYVWVAGSALAGLGGLLFALTEDVSWDMGFRILLLMFAGVTLGGLGTAYGALLGSLVVGIFIQYSTYVVPSDMKNIGALATLVVILMFRPQGILGKAERVG